MVDSVVKVVFRFVHLALPVICRLFQSAKWWVKKVVGLTVDDSDFTLETIYKLHSRGEVNGITMERVKDWPLVSIVIKPAYLSTVYRMLFRPKPW